MVSHIGKIENVKDLMRDKKIPTLGININLVISRIITIPDLFSLEKKDLNIYLTFIRRRNEELTN